MISIANDIARTAPATQAEGVVADLSDFTATANGSALDDMRRQHAETWSSFMLSNADTSPTANVQQTVQVSGTEFSINADLSPGLNARAGLNAAEAAKQMAAMGFHPDAIARAQELIRHHSVDAGSKVEIAQNGAADPGQPYTLVQPQDISEQIGIQEGLQNGQPVTEAIAQADANIDAHMQDLTARIDQDESLAAAIGRKAPVEITEPIQDPLEHSPFMKIEEGLDQPVATGLTQQSGIRLADSGRFDMDFADRLDMDQAVQVTSAQTQPNLRFDYQTGQEIQAGEIEPGQAGQTQNSGFDTPLGPALAIAPIADVAFKLARGSEPGETRRVGRERQSVYLAAA